MEGYWTGSDGRPDTARLAQAAEASGRGAVRFLGSVTVPTDETVFWLFEATTRAELEAAATVAGMKVDRIVAATTQGVDLEGAVPVADELPPGSPQHDGVDR